jgi:hypothetical protein
MEKSADSGPKFAPSRAQFSIFLSPVQFFILGGTDRSTAAASDGVEHLEGRSAHTKMSDRVATETSNLPFLAQKIETRAIPNRLNRWRHFERKVRPPITV